MNRALQTAEVENSPDRYAMHRLLSHTVERIVDWDHWGIYRDGTSTGGPLIKDKEFWQNAEVFVGFLDGYETFKEERFLDAFEGVWRFVNKHMIAHDVGEWRTLLDRNGDPIDPKIGKPWKVAYHSGHSMLECATRLRYFLET